MQQLIIHGGSGRSAIFKKLVDLVGAKGAVSVCAAGNESADNDKTASYPANYDSAYKISVAATNEKVNSVIIQITEVKKLTLQHLEVIFSLLMQWIVIIHLFIQQKNRRK